MAKSEIFVVDRVGSKKRKQLESKSEEANVMENSELDLEEPAVPAKSKSSKKDKIRSSAQDEKTAKTEKNQKKNKKETVEKSADESEELNGPATDGQEATEESGKQPKKKKKGDKGSKSEPEQLKNVGTKRGTEAGRLDEATLPYVREVTNLAKADDFETDEDRSIFVDNVWRELKMGNTDQLVRLITHKEGSVAVQSLLALSTPRQLYRFCRGLKGVMPRVIFNPYGSHVLEALFGYVPRLVNASMDEFKQAEEDGEEEGGAAGEDLETLEKLFQDTSVRPPPPPP